jgi:hypothetical protein
MYADEDNFEIGEDTELEDFAELGEFDEDGNPIGPLKDLDEVEVEDFL